MPIVKKAGLLYAKVLKPKSREAMATVLKTKMPARKAVMAARAGSKY